MDIKQGDKVRVDIPVPPHARCCDEEPDLREGIVKHVHSSPPVIHVNPFPCPGCGSRTSFSVDCTTGRVTKISGEHKGRWFSNKKGNHWWRCWSNKEKDKGVIK